ncbi:MAG: hypothetical protein EOO65_05935, partial [Methanosarcinales archaeon]
MAESACTRPLRARCVLQAHYAELSKAYIEARDNVKFLSTLERHFKTLATGSLATIGETLLSLMNGLRMVWIISRHYNTDDQMLPLMKRIVNELVDKVSNEVNIKSILRLARNEPTEALEVMRQAKLVLDTWHSTYMQVRERIEKSTDHRWYVRRALAAFRFFAVARFVYHCFP